MSDEISEVECVMALVNKLADKITIAEYEEMLRLLITLLKTQLEKIE